jgi:ABC-type multidrug transport system ATPase subunit
LLGYGPDRIPLPATALAGELLRLTAWGRGDGRDLGRTSIAERLEIKTFLDRRVAALSLGQCRRLILTATLAAEPAIALLDEPTVGLDVDGIRHLVAIIEERQRQGRLTICVTHENWAIALPFAELISWSEFATVESSCNR